jgi:high affinity sulfate transporter 1
VAGLIAITEGIAIGRSFAALEGYHIDGNKEFIAFGVMNIAGSATSCYTTTGSFSRSAVNYNAGVYTTVSNIVMSLVVMVVLLALTPLFADTPNTILAAIIIAAVVSLINVRAAYLIWKVDKFDFIALLGAFFGTLFISVEIGLLIAVSKASTLPPNQCSLHHC